MRPFTRKNEFQRAIESLEGSAHSLTEGWSKDRAVKAALIAGGLTVLTAGARRLQAAREAAAKVFRSGDLLGRLSRQANGISSVLAADRNSRLSEGALVEAHVRARVLGIPLLKVEALVALLPARIATRFAQAAEVRTFAPTRPAASRKMRSEAPGSGLAEAIRSLEEARDTLAAVQGDGLRVPRRARRPHATR
jgi:hypothetical protein